MLDWHNKHNKNQTATAKHFATVFPHLHIKQPLISAWSKAEVRIRQQNIDHHALMKRGRDIQYPEVEKLLSKWVSQAILANVLIDGDTIRQKWRDFARLHQVPSNEWLKLSNGWLARFKARHGLRASVRHGEGAAADPATIAEEVERVKLINSDYALNNIFNMDETGLFYA